MKIPNKKEFQQTASNHLPDIDFKDFIKLYKDYTKELYTFFVSDTILWLYCPMFQEVKAIRQ